MSRVDPLTPIHKALRSMIFDLGMDLQTADFTDTDATAALVSRLKHDLSSAARAACTLCVLHQHAGDEETSVFPRLGVYEPQLVDTMLQEHAEILKQMNVLWKLADEVVALEDRDQRIAAGARLNRGADEFFAYYLTHMHHEEVAVIPAMWDHFTDQQLAEMSAEIQKNIPPEQSAEFMKWLLPALNVQELTGMVLGMKRQMPPPVFENTIRGAQAVVGDARWEAVKANAGL